MRTNTTVGLPYVASSLSDPPPTPLSFPKLRNAEFARSYDPLATHGTQIEPVADAPEPEPTKDYDRFDIVRLYAKGGQGHVFVARDTQLGREVALKELQPRFADRALSRSRFVREAEITGSLEHPGVVPVYALGHHQGGRPYYAMRLIQGRNMQEVIQEYHDPETNQSPAERNLKFRQLLQRFVSVCQTIAYAHSRCIVHRDIKPSNVLIGSYGEAVVVDWGLARPFHPTAGCANEPEQNEPGDSGPPLVAMPQGKSPNDSTMMGTALGTPAFMSPEQAEGRWDMVGPASDIYALGTSLYVLVSGHMPIEFTDWPTMAKKIRAGEIPPARTRNPEVPRALEAICQKAMALKPTDRYQSALALAGDIEHWLADEPVTAWAEPWHLRAARWSRRHRTLVASMGALCLTAVVGLAIGLFAVDQERQRTEFQRGQTQKQLVRAESARQDARAAFDRNFSLGLQDTFRQQRGGLTTSQRAMLANSVAAYERFAQESPQDVAGRIGVVSAYRKIGEIRNSLGMNAEAGMAMTEALTRCKALAEERPGDLEIRRELAHVHASRGRLFRELGKPREAADEFVAALSIFQDFAAANPDDLGVRRDLAHGYANSAAALSDIAKLADKDDDKLKQSSAVIETFRTALKIAESVAAATSDPADTRELAVALNNLGKAVVAKLPYVDLATKLELGRESEAIFRRAKEIGDRLVARDAEDDDSRELLASSCRSLGVAIRRNEQLAVTKPSTDPAAIAKAKAYKSATTAEVQKVFGEAAEQFESLANKYPGDHKYGLDADALRCNIAELHRKFAESNADDPHKTIAAQEAALHQFSLVIQRIERAKKDDPKHMTLLIAAYKGRKQALLDLKRYPEAIAAISKLVEIDPKKVGIWRSLRAVTRVRMKEFEPAFAEVNELLKSPSTDKGETLYNCACFYSMVSDSYADRKFEYLRKAVELLKQSREQGFFAQEEHIVDMENDPDLTQLRNEADYKAFLAELKQPAAPKK